MKKKSENKSLVANITTPRGNRNRANNSIDWSPILTDYLSDDTSSYRSLADKYNISLQAITNRGNAQQWVKLRQENIVKAQALAEEKALQIRKDRNDAHIEMSMQIQGIAQQQLAAGIVPKNARDLINWVSESIKIEREARGMTTKQQSLTIGNQRGQTIRLEWGNGSSVEPH